jgi:putative tryptophan/tyrosine transport system substrate-binding protein
MKRRTVLSAAGIWPWVKTARAQPVRRPARIGILGTTASRADMLGAQPRSPFAGALMQGLRDLGYVHGEDFVFEPRSSEGQSERLPALAAELVALPVDVIVAAGPALPTLQRATKTIPIVMTGSADPVGQGFVRSLARPGGNITGLSLQSVDTTGKRLELLGEVVRPMNLVAVLWDRYSLLNWQEAQAAARRRGWKLLSLEIRDPGEIDAALARASEARASALLVFNSALFDRQAARIASLVAQRRLPAMYGLRIYVEAGGLMAYGADLLDNWRRAASFVDRILKGSPPADLPVEQPTKFNWVINLQAAQALGLTIPQPLRLRADEVIG